MRYRLFGRTGLYVSELCFGAMTFGGTGIYESMGKTAQAEADELDRVSALPAEYPGWVLEFLRKQGRAPAGAR